MTATATADLFTSEILSIGVKQHELPNGGAYFQVDSSTINMERVIAGIFGIEDEDVTEEMMAAGEELGLDRIDAYAHDFGHYGIAFYDEAVAVFANERLVSETFSRFL